MDAFIFFRALGITSLFVALVGGFGYWIYTFYSQRCPNLKYIIKYKVLRKKYNVEVVSGLMDDLANEVSDKDLINNIVLSNSASPDQAKEMLYIYKELKKLTMKGGTKNE